MPGQVCGSGLERALINLARLESKCKPVQPNPGDSQPKGRDSSFKLSASSKTASRVGNDQHGHEMLYLGGLRLLGEGKP